MAKRKSASAAQRERAAIDEAILAVLIAAMDANRHVSREELSRAHHLIWSTRRFRRKSGEALARLIDRARARVEQEDAATVIEEAAVRIPQALRLPVYAAVVDLLLAEGGLDASEKAFLGRLATTLGLRRDRTGALLAAMVVKNSL